jgi:hypothetical protein
MEVGNLGPPVTTRARRDLVLRRAGGDLPREHERISEFGKFVDLAWADGPRVRLGLEDWTLSYRVGAVWARPEQDWILWVEPKFEKLDILQVVFRCLEAADTAGKVFGEPWPAIRVWPEEAHLPIPVEQWHDLEPVIALAYVKQLYEFCVRRLRRGYERVERNLTGRVRGKVVVGRSIRSNLARCRTERMICAYDEHLLDTPVNRILRAALEVRRVS